MSNCDKWSKDKGKNPLTGRKTKEGTELYKLFDDFCKDEVGVCKKLKNYPEKNPIGRKKYLNEVTELCKSIKLDSRCSSPVSNTYCTKWSNNKGINPLTGRKTKEGTELYKLFDDFCANETSTCNDLNVDPYQNPIGRNKYLDQVKQLCNIPLTRISKASSTTTDKECNILGYNPLSCTMYPNITLKQHQKDVCRKVLTLGLKRLLLFHSLGSGKTITSLTLLRCLNEKYPDSEIYIATPKSVLQNFKKDLTQKLKIKLKINLVTHHKLANNIKKNGIEFLRNSLIVIDEAHNFKALGGARSKLLMAGTSVAKCVYLLTGTPIQNYPIEFTNLYAILSNTEDQILKAQHIFKNFDNKKEYIKGILKNKISYFKNSDTTEYPSVSYNTKYFTMTDDYYTDYYQAIEGCYLEKVNLDPPFIKARGEALIPFYNGIRRAVNHIDRKVMNAKMYWIIEHIKKHPDSKIVCYSNWIGSGLDRLKDELDLLDINYVYIEGGVSLSDRKQVVEDYNTDKVKVLFISAAGAEGLDLKGTNDIIILEPHWNNERIRQTIGRGVRFRSHSHLPADQRHVTVYNLILQKNNADANVITHDLSGDELLELYRSLRNKLSADDILRIMSLYKDKLLDDFYDLLIEVSI